MRTVVDHYANTRSTVTLFEIDISKAFDRVDHYALLDLLLNRQFPINFIAIFTTGCLNVKYMYVGERHCLLLSQFGLESDKVAYCHLCYLLFMLMC